MNNELNIEISKIISLANGDPSSILPSLFSSSSRPPATKRPSSSSSSSSGSGPEASSDSDDESPSSSAAEASTAKALPPPPPPPPLKDPTPYDPQQQLSKKLRLNNYMPLGKCNRRYKGMTAASLRYLIQGDRVISFCQERGLISRQVECWCGKQMKLGGQLSSSDGCRWECRHEGGKKIVKQTIRKGSWFGNARISISDILWIAYMWVHEYSQISMLHECEHTHATVFDWSQRCIEICRSALEYKKEPLGGNEKSVELYEGKFKAEGKAWHSRDREKWVFCAIEQYNTNSLLFILKDKDSKTLTDIFDTYFLPGTTVVTHIWCAFENMTIEDFKYLTEEKGLLFYDQGEKRDMIEFEVFKKTTKRPPPGLNRHNKLEYGPKFFEKMYRKSLAYAPDSFLAFLNDVSMINKPCEKIVKSQPNV